MKIGILTFHNEKNYGAFMQAYALYTFLNKKNDVEVELINLDFTNGKRNLKNRVLSFIKTLRFNKAIRNNLKLSKRICNEEKFYTKANEYDLIIVGSDQVWAFDIINKYEKYFYLDFNFKNTKKCSYAASFGKNDNITNNKENIIKYLKSFDNISIREADSAKIINDLGIKCHDNIDPTFLLTKDDYVKNFKLSKNNKRYMLVYMLVIDEQLIELAKRISDLLEIDIICFNNKNRFGKRGKCKPNASPKEFLELFYNAEFIITNSFHGTCFSIIFEKQFITVAHKEKGIRQVNLLNKAGMSNRLFNIDIDINKYINEKCCKKSEFEEYINDSKKYLNEL